MTNNFNSLNQIEGTTVNVARVTMLGEVNYPMGTVTVGSVQAVLHGTTFEAPNVPVAMGSNVLTAIYEGPGFTNTGHIATATVGVVISNRLYAHDANGNLTNDAVFAYAWDAANQLTNVVRIADDVRVLSMRYDALGRRVEVTRADDSIERYVYIPGTFMVLAVLDGDNEIKELYTHGPHLSGTLGGAGGIGGILADFRPPTSDLRSLHSDAMGSIVLVTDETGAEAARYRYTSFGREIQREGDYESRYRFSSKEFDPETRLVYYGFRHYSPALGRWINRDPIGEEGGRNLYQSFGNASMIHLDPFGLQLICCNDPLHQERCRRERIQREAALAAELNKAALKHLGAEAIGGATVGFGVGYGIGFVVTKNKKGAMIGGEVAAGVAAIHGIYRFSRASRRHERAMKESRKLYETCMEACNT